MSSDLVHFIQPYIPIISATLPDFNKISSLHTSNLIIPVLPSAASQCHTSPKLASVPLLYIVILCDHDCDSNFHKKFVKISLNGVPILTDNRSSNGLWTITHPQSPTPTTIHENLVTSTATNIVTKYIALYHTKFFYPTISTWWCAINAGHLTTWTHLTSKQARKYIP